MAVNKKLVTGTRWYSLDDIHFFNVKLEATGKAFERKTGPLL